MIVAWAAGEGIGGVIVGDGGCDFADRGVGAVAYSGIVGVRTLREARGI